MESLIKATDQIIANVPIGQSKQVVLVDVAGRKDISAEDSSANIYCVDERGVVIWQIDARLRKWSETRLFLFDRPIRGCARIGFLARSSR